MTKEQHEQARRELGFPVNRLADPNPWPDMEDSLMDDACF